MKKSTNLDVLMAMLDMTVEELIHYLYQLSEEYEETTAISGLYARQVFRSFWMRSAENLSDAFLNKLRITKQGEMCLQEQSKKGYEFIYGTDNIRKRYFRYLRKLLKQPINTAVMEMITKK